MSVHYTRAWAVLFVVNGVVLLLLLSAAHFMRLNIPWWYWLPALTVLVQGILMFMQPSVRLDEDSLTVYHKFIPMVRRVSLSGTRLEKKGGRLILRPEKGRKLVISPFMLDRQEFQRLEEALAHRGQGDRALVDH